MRVLLVNDLAPGPGSGAEVHVQLLVRALEAAGDTVEVLWADHPHRGVGRALDVWDPRARRHLRAVAGSFRPDVVHFHNVLRELSMSVLSACPRVPSVMTLHDHRLLGARDGSSGGLVHQVAAGALGRVARRMARRRIDAVVSLSDETSARLRAGGFREVEQMDLFVADPGPPALPAGLGSDVVFAGRLAADKGALALAQAFARVAARHSDARLVLAGDGPERERIEALAEQTPGRMVVLGQVSLQEAHRLMSCARVVAVPSVQALRPETGPLTVLEAAIRARPVITTAGVPLAALVARAGGGVVVPAGSPSALSDAIGELLGDPERASAAGERARAHAVAHHTPEVVVPRLRQLYRDLSGPGA